MNLEAFLKDGSDSIVEKDEKRGAALAVPGLIARPGAYSRDQNDPIRGDSMGCEQPDEPLFGQRIPDRINIRETPEHRQMVDLRAEGYTITEIAELLGRSKATVSNICRQPWAQKRLTEGANMLRERLVVSIANDALESYHKLIELRDDEETPKHVVSDICKNHLDRVLGKPTQPLAVYDGLDEEALAKLPDAELAKFLPNTSHTGTSEPKAIADNASETAEGR